KRRQRVARLEAAVDRRPEHRMVVIFQPGAGGVLVDDRHLRGGHLPVFRLGQSQIEPRRPKRAQTRGKLVKQVLDGRMGKRRDEDTERPTRSRMGSGETDDGRREEVRLAGAWRPPDSSRSLATN